MGIRILKGNKPTSGADTREAIEIPRDVEAKGAAAIAAYMKNPAGRKKAKPAKTEGEGE